MLTTRILFLVVIFSSCKSEQKPVADVTPASAAEVPSPFFFRIVGDFDGDTKLDTLTEQLSDIHGKQYFWREFAANDKYDTIAGMVTHGEVFTQLSSSNPQMRPLLLPGSIGVAFLQNEGDLDGDGADEFSYVPQWYDMSSINAYYVTSWKRGKWKTIYTFPMWEWQLPPTPDASPNYGYFGSTEHTKTDETYTDTLLQILSNFSLVKKLAPGRIRITTRAELDYGDSIAIAESMIAEVKLQNDTGSIVKVMVDTSGRN